MLSPLQGSAAATVAGNPRWWLSFAPRWTPQRTRLLGRWLVLLPLIAKNGRSILIHNLHFFVAGCCPAYPGRKAGRDHSSLQSSSVLDVAEGRLWDIYFDDQSWWAMVFEEHKQLGDVGKPDKFGWNMGGDYLSMQLLKVAYMKQDHLKTLGPYFVPRLQLWKTRISKGAEKKTTSWFMMCCKLYRDVSRLASNRDSK